MRSSCPWTFGTGNAIVLAVAYLFLAGSALAQPPLLNEPPRIGESKPTTGFAAANGQEPPARWIDTAHRALVGYLYKYVYVPTGPVDPQWTGSVAACAPGDISQNYRDANLARINWFRAMAGVPAGTRFDPVYNAKDQAAALIMAANNQLSHNPDSSWTCYTPDGAEAASKSNICLGPIVSDPGCTSLYMEDPGANNAAAGHRRWILFPQTTLMGTGVASTGAGRGGHAMWVIDSPTISSPRPDTREQYSAWPPPGYVPYQQVFPRWSFSFAGADFSNAAVAVRVNGVSTAVTIESRQNGFGENTIVWNFAGAPASGSFPNPGADAHYDVDITNVVAAGQTRSFYYRVTLFDPSLLSASPAAAFREANGSIAIWRRATGAPLSAGGSLSSEPAIAVGYDGAIYVAALDSYGAVWINRFTISSAWSGWLSLGGSMQGMPALTPSTDGGVWVGARDQWKAYHVTHFVPGSPIQAWRNLGGAFETSPALAAGVDGALYIVGRDFWDGLWSAFLPPSGVFAGWVLGGGVVQGTPSLATGLDGAAYLVTRDKYNGLWAARVQDSVWTGWKFGGGILQQDPSIAASKDGLLLVAVNSQGALWHRRLEEGAAGAWRPWTSAGGVVDKVRAVALGRGLSVAVTDSQRNLWWFDIPSSLWAWQGLLSSNSAADAGPR